MTHLNRYALIAACAMSASAASGVVLAADPHMHQVAAPAQATPSYPLSEGEVKKVDKEAGKITIKHGPLKNLGMPNMTMVFRATDPAMLDQVKAGDKIRFEADQANGAYLVKKIEVVK